MRGESRIISLFLVFVMINSICWNQDIIIGKTSVFAATYKQTEVDSSQENIVTTGSAVTVEPTISPNVTIESTAIPEHREADMRLLFTTDLHGKVTGYDYQLGKIDSQGSLAKLSTMIKEAKVEAGQEKTLTFDVGDSLFDLTTEYIYAEDQTQLQPIFAAMTKIGYDAITLGNHDFDYGYDYIVNQLKLSGLDKLCVLSNVFDSITGENEFGESKIIQRSITDNQGNLVNVKIGIIGETTPALSSKTESYTGILKTEDIVSNVKTEAKKLKKEGADCIVVLSHSGIGPENPTEKYANVDYALTKIPEVDIILAGHEHNYFPTDSKESASYYDLPGIDKETGLVNGKRLVMIKDSGKALGVVDLKFSFDEKNNLVYNGSDYEIRKAKDYDVEEDSEILSYMGLWDQKIKDYCNTAVGAVAEGKQISNYLGVMEDTSVLNIVENALIDYGSHYIYSEAQEYEGLPIISMVRYPNSVYSLGDYTSLTGDITKGKVSALALYHRYVYIYKITGKQLKEWLEWSASIYETCRHRRISRFKELRQL